MCVLTKFGSRSFLLAYVVGLIVAASPAVLSAASTEAALADIVGRLDYGYYTGDARLIEAARSDLERSSKDGSLKAYYVAYAAYRLSQLGAADSNRARRDLVAGCVDSAREATVDPTWALEAWVLIAACSLQGGIEQPARRLGHDLRLADALAAARELNPQHPRLLLITAWASRRSDAGEGNAAQGQILEQARLQFEAWRGSGLEPTWGKAETLASLGQVFLELGQLREARDVIEQSLIEAPEYPFALELRNALSLQR
jgi:hypothetical protein